MTTKTTTFFLLRFLIIIIDTQNMGKQRRRARENEEGEKSFVNSGLAGPRCDCYSYSYEFYVCRCSARKSVTDDDVSI